MTVLKIRPARPEELPTLGTQILVANGATEIRGDCDASNIAMFKAFRRAGYRNFANRTMFSRPL